MSQAGTHTSYMRTRVSTVALGCLKIGGAGTLLSVPLGLVNHAAGEATWAAGIATMLVSGAVARVADKREVARATLAARRVLARAKVVGGRDAGTHFTGGSVVISWDGAQISD